jgi:DNA polymerase I-like protein with 3'-5' exonuclease and polymerase domains
MIYLVSTKTELFDSDSYKIISVEESLEYIKAWSVVQFDTETSGRNTHLCDILCMQFGNKLADTQIVVDCTTIDIMLYKEMLETKLLVGHNLKFDIQFLYKHGIIPSEVWDTMVVEQLLHLGYDNKYFHYSLKDVAARRLAIDIDKTVRGEIIWRGLDTNVIIYAAGDVMYLEDIRNQQLEECHTKTCVKAAQLENKFVPVIAYLEFCGIKLDEDKWKLKMQNNENALEESTRLLNKWLIDKSNEMPELKQWVTINLQGSLFDGFDTEPKCTINWSSSAQVVKLVKLLGFDTQVEDKTTGKKKDSVVEKHLVKQKGIDDEFLKLYFAYQEAAKVCSTYGENYLNAINPKTGRIHTTFRQLGASSGRMSCGSSQTDSELAKAKGLSPSKCKFVQLQNLPSDEVTRSAFVPEQGNLMVSADYSALESRLGADIYDEKEMLREYIEGSGDIHSLVAKACFPEELEGIEVKDIKRLRPDLRKKAKAPEFACQFGGGAKAISQSLSISYQEAKKIEQGYFNMFKGITDFKAKGSKFVRTNGYIVICKHTGHKIYWEDFKKWRKYEDMPEAEFDLTLSRDERYEHNAAAAKWDRLALNSPTQGTGSAIIKYASTLYFNWIKSKNLFGKVLLCDLVHDEIVSEFPKELVDTVPDMLVKCMEKAASVLCKKLPIPAEPAIGDHWIH